MFFYVLRVIAVLGMTALVIESWGAVIGSAFFVLMYFITEE